jgi:vacuolar-type H+-ATPase subunit E/Vma4
MSSLSFVKEGDEGAAQAAEQEQKIIDKRPLAVILQANREAKEAEMQAKIKARDKLLTVTEDDVAFESTQDYAKQRREAEVAKETQRALDEFRSAVADRVVVVASTDDVATTTTIASSTSSTSSLKRSAESALAPVLPPIKKAAVVSKVPLVQVKKPAAAAVNVKPKVNNTSKKPSAGIAMLGGYDDSSSDE